MIGYRSNTHGRYKCEYCGHPTYKTISGIENHLRDQHLHTWQLAKKDAEIERLKNQPPKVIQKERIVYRDAPKPKDPEYWYGVAGIYCSSCRRVQSNPGIPVGQTIENTPCSNCRNRTLMLVKEIN